MGNSIESYTRGRKKKYKEVRSELKTGDILIFSGFGADSDCIKCFTTTPWSHVGMVLRLDDFKPERLKPDNHNLYCWHSTLFSYHDVPDLLQGKGKSGAQLNKLSSVMRNYSGRIVLRKLQNPIPNLNEQNIIEFITEQSKGIYEYGASELVNSVYEGSCPSICWTNDKAYFCSELAAKTYRDLFHILKTKRKNNLFIPADFASGGLIEDNLKDNKLEDEIEILKPKN
jgi:hypothetical protein